MFASAVRNAPRRVLVSKLPLKPTSSRRFLSTAPPSQESRSWKSSAVRWAIAGAGVYYYNTSSMFAEQPEDAIARLDQSIHHVQQSSLSTVDAIVEEKHRRHEQEVQAVRSLALQEGAADEDDIGSVEDLEDEADQQGAFNPETGEINWDCPCLGGMAHGPCGPEFKEAFSCFVHSTEEPKGMECIEKFKGMQDCFRQHPEMYPSELEDDEYDDEEEETGIVAASPNGSEAPTTKVTQVSKVKPTEPVAEAESKAIESITVSPRSSDVRVEANARSS